MRTAATMLSRNHSAKQISSLQSAAMELLLMLTNSIQTNIGNDIPKAFQWILNDIFALSL